MAMLCDKRDQQTLALKEGTMRAIGIVLLSLTASMWLGFATPAIADTVDEARAKFVAAYNNQDYAALCNVLHEHASFRGSVYPEKWTHTRDSIITERYKSSNTCTEVSKGAQAKPLADTKSVGSMIITLDSETVTPIGDRYALDVGNFKMAVMPGAKAEPTGGPYVILWIKQGGDWKMMHIDMNP